MLWAESRCSDKCWSVVTKKTSKSNGKASTWKAKIDRLEGINEGLADTGLRLKEVHNKYQKLANGIITVKCKSMEIKITVFIIVIEFSPSG